MQLPGQHLSILRRKQSKQTRIIRDGLVMYHDCSLGGLTSIDITGVSGELSNTSEWAQNTAPTNATAAALGDGSYEITENAVSAQPARHTIYIINSYAPVLNETSAGVSKITCRVKRGVGTRNFAIRGSGWTHGIIWDLGTGAEISRSSGVYGSISGPDAEGYYTCTAVMSVFLNTNHIFALSMYSNISETYTPSLTPSSIIVRDVTWTQPRVTAWAGQSVDAVIDQSYIAANLAQWVQQRAVIAASGSDWSLTEDSTASNTHNASLSATFSLAIPVTITVSVKRGTGSRDVSLYVGGNVYAFVRLSDGAVTLTNGTCTVTADGDWWVISLTTAATAPSSAAVYLYLTAAGAVTYSGDGSSSLIVRSGITISQAPSAVQPLDFVQGTTNAQPSLMLQDNAGSLALINGYTCPFLAYDSAAANNKFLPLDGGKQITNNLHDGTGCTYVLALYPQSTVAASRIIVSTASTATSNIGFSMYYDSTSTVVTKVVNGTDSSVFRASSPVTIATPQIYTYRMSTAYGSSLRRNGVEILAPAALSAAACVANHTEAFKYGRAATVSNADALYMGDALYGVVLSDAECLRVEKYFASKMGISL